MLKIEAYFTKDLETDQAVFDTVKWAPRLAQILDDKKKIVFKQDNVYAPTSWSDLAVTIVASKYFYGEQNTDERETSIRDLIARVTWTISGYCFKQKYMDALSAEVFRRELIYLFLHQYASMNSPVWFNVGLEQYDLKNKDKCYYWNGETNQVEELAYGAGFKPQTSACFIQSVDDTMTSIMQLATNQAMLYKNGSGTGTDLSTLRSCKEKLSGGGTPSGPLSFMRIFDKIAEVVKSGGKTRRAAAMESLRIDHPDIMEFIRCKAAEERKAKFLIQQEYLTPEEAYNTIDHQNANLSVRITDEFMQHYLDKLYVETKAVTTGEVVNTYKATELMDAIAEAAHFCGDPGVQFHNTINRAHTCKESGDINASNPCSEFMFIDDSACNLASINLLKLYQDGKFNYEAFAMVIRLMIIAQDSLIDASTYPTKKIAQNSHDFRPLGLGFCNLGALLMVKGLAYDSDAARAEALYITQRMTTEAYRTSAKIATVLGAFSQYTKNEESMKEVLDKQLLVGSGMLSIQPVGGYRNAQVTVLAPTGTIGFMMDCDTTGIEPELALVKYKVMSDGGVTCITNPLVADALKTLGLEEPAIALMLNEIQEKRHLEDSELSDKHKAVFDCALQPANGKRFIHHMGHLKMMAAVQPYLSGAISKTVNVPNSITVDEIKEIYVEAWKMGLKSVAIYRDGCKEIQPLQVTLDTETDVEKIIEIREVMKPYRKRLPETRDALIHKFEIAGHEGYFTVGLYPDGEPGELFITMAKEGSTISGMMDVFGISISMALQYGVPIESLIDKFKYCSFEPSGMTKNKNIPFARSIADYIFKWMEIEFVEPPEDDEEPETPVQKLKKGVATFTTDAPLCDVCGSITQRNGSCHRCSNCGNSMGCS